MAIAQAENGRYEPLLWTRSGSALAFLAAVDSAKNTPGPATLWIWDGATRKPRAAVRPEQAPKGWTLPFKNDIAWTRDGKRLFFGFKPADAEARDAKDSAKKPAPDPFDFEQILSKVELDVWHWNDPKIDSEQKKAWDREKDRTYRGGLAPRHRPRGAAGGSRPARRGGLRDIRAMRSAPRTCRMPKQTTWGEGARDVYLVDLADGSRKLVTARLGGRAIARARRPDRRLLQGRPMASLRLRQGLDAQRDGRPRRHAAQRAARHARHAAGLRHGRLGG